MAFKGNGNKILINETISNTSVNVIEITEDKLVNILNKHIAKIQKSNDWMGAVAMVISLFGILFSSTFHDTFGIPKETLQGFFIFVLIGAFIYMIYTIKNCFCNTSNINKILKDIKGKK